MTTRKFLSNHLDLVGFITSTICAIHCAAVPLILMFGSLGSFAWLADHSIEFGFIAVSLVLAYWSLWSSYQKHHRDPKALRIVIIGFMILLGSRLLPHAIGDIFVVIGGSCVAYAHYANWRLLQDCRRCCQEVERPDASNALPELIYNIAPIALLRSFTYFLGSTSQKIVNKS